MDSTSHTGSGPEAFQEEASWRQSEASAFFVSSQRIRVAACPRPRDEWWWRKDSQEKFLFCRILGPIPDVIYRGDHSGGPMSAITAAKPLDREAFDRLVGELRPKLHRYCARMTGSVVEGEDVLHEAIVKAIEA